MQPAAALAGQVANQQHAGQGKADYQRQPEAVHAQRQREAGQAGVAQPQEGAQPQAHHPKRHDVDHHRHGSHLITA